MSAYLNVFRNYFNFSSKTKRSDYIQAMLLHLLISIVFFMLDYYFSLNFYKDYGGLTLAYGLLSTIPFLALQWRRGQDSGLNVVICSILIGLTFIKGFYIIVAIFLGFRSTSTVVVEGSMTKENI